MQLLNYIKSQTLLQEKGIQIRLKNILFRKERMKNLNGVQVS